MLQLSRYDTYIFDCDGVVLNSNQLKIEAMKNALEENSFAPETINSCLEYFRNNFGKSRFHHVDIFLSKIINISEKDKDKVRISILESYSSQCKVLYLESELTPDFVQFINSLDGNKYIASGSEQEELRSVFKSRNLNKYFNNIYGSPTLKVKLVENILKNSNSKKAVFFGDAHSDLEAALQNKVDFVAYLPYSNVASSLEEKANNFGFKAINGWREIL